jgi:hypothetical protein
MNNSFLEVNFTEKKIIVPSDSIATTREKSVVLLEEGIRNQIIIRAEARQQES